MKEERDYIQDINEIRSMMERSSKFLSLSGLAGVMAGIYALAGAGIARYVFEFNPQSLQPESLPSSLTEVVGLALVVLILAVGTAVFLSGNKAKKRGEKVWNATSKLMITQMSVPLAAGGVFVIILLSKGLVGLVAPATLLFYGMALYTAGKFTYDDIKGLGLIQVGLGLAGAWFIDYGLVFWAAGFGLAHIAYGMYMHFSYER